MLDIDNFKQINDQYGHDMGDDALTVVSNLVVQTVREEDICCRFEGDEFAILLPPTAPREAFFLA